MDQVGYREVVLVEDLAPLVQKVVDKRQRVRDEETTTSPGGQMIGVLAELSEQSGIAERRIYAILRHETAAVDLDVADRILLACGLFVELEIPDAIYPAEEVREATLEQASMMPDFARRRGLTIPEQGTSARRSWGGTIRKIAEKEKRSRQVAA